jgi:hypothetical protein
MGEDELKSNVRRLEKVNLDVDALDERSFIRENGYEILSEDNDENDRKQ